MKITKPLALILAAFTLWPFLYMLLFIGFMFSAFLWMGPGAGGGPGARGGPPTAFFMIFIMHFLTILEGFALLAIYIIHLFKTPLVAADKKALWAVVLFFGNMFAMPVYWYIYIWKPLREDAPADMPAS